MKYFANVLLGALAGVAYAEQMVDLAKETKVYKSHFGAIVEESSWDELTRKVITFPAENFMKDYQQQAEHLSNLTKTIRAQKLRDVAMTEDQPTYTCTSRQMPDGTMTDPFEFLPVFAGEISPSNPTDVYYATGKCFQSISF